MLALALILDGRSFTAAAEATGQNQQTLRDWVHRYNEHGVDGLTDSWGGGRKALLNTPQMDRLPDPHRDWQSPVYMPIDKGRDSVPHDLLPLPLLMGSIIGRKARCERVCSA